MDSAHDQLLLIKGYLLAVQAPPPIMQAWQLAFEGSSSQRLDHEEAKVIAPQPARHAYEPYDPKKSRGPMSDATKEKIRAGQLARRAREAAEIADSNTKPVSPVPKLKREVIPSGNA